MRPAMIRTAKSRKDRASEERRCRPVPQITGKNARDRQQRAAGYKIEKAECRAPQVFRRGIGDERR